MAFLIADPAHAIDLDEWVGVIGVSGDGRRYALCRALGWGESTMREECRTFRATVQKTEDDDGIHRRAVYMCRTTADPPTTAQAVKHLCEQSWELENDEASLKKAESELKAHGIRLADSVQFPSVSRNNRFRIPSGTMKRFGVDGSVVGVWTNDNVGGKDKDGGGCCYSEWHMRFHAKGYGGVSIRQGRSHHGVWEYKLSNVSVSRETPWLFYNVGVVAEEAAYTLPWGIRLDHLAARLLNSRGYRKHKTGDFVGSARDFTSAFSTLR